MTEWVIDLETPSETIQDEESLDRLHDTLLAAGSVFAAACALNTETGTASARFVVDAETFSEALNVGLTAWFAALQSAGLPEVVGRFILATFG
jgi:hypothetical protein